MITQPKSMNRWRELIQRMITKQQIKNEQIKKTNLLFVFCKMCLNSKKQVRARSKEFLGNKNNINQKKDHLEKLQVTMSIT